MIAASTSPPVKNRSYIRRTAGLIRRSTFPRQPGRLVSHSMGGISPNDCTVPYFCPSQK